MNAYPPAIAQAIHERKPFVTGQLRGASTVGGTYILTSPALMNDDNRRRDLIAITRLGDVIALWPTANLAPVMEALA